MAGPFAFVRQGNMDYGCRLVSVSGSSATIEFGAGGYTSNNTTYGVAGLGWSIVYTANQKWRVRKVSGGAQVGFPISSANILGRTDGLAPAAGIVGEVIEANQTSDVVASANDSTYSDLTGTAIALTRGRWRITCMFGAYVPAWTGGTATILIGALYSTGTVLVKNQYIGGAVTAGQSATFVSSSFTVYVTVDSNTSYYLRGAFTRYAGVENVTTGPTFKQDRNWISAERIA
jgi:hypothetical protein